MCSSGAVRFVDDSPLEGGGFELLVPPSIKLRSGAPCGFRVRLHQLGEPPIPGGTGSSKPSPSSGESANLRSLSADLWRSMLSFSRVRPVGISSSQRCLAHKVRNLQAKVPEDFWPEFKAPAIASSSG
jgi:hypothetical protein